MASSEGAAHDWARDVHHALRAHEVRQVSTVPDAGLTRLLELCGADRAMRLVTLTSEEEGIGLAAGAWLGGARSALLLQSSGVGNCINALSLPALCGVPLLMIVTMRGEWGEFNPWQIPMGQSTEPVLQLAGALTYRATEPAQLGETVEAGARIAFNSDRMVAVLISQRVIGAKSFK